MQLHKEEDAFMVPGMGAQPVPVKECVAANDNHPDWDGIARDAVDRFPTVHETLAKSERGPLELPPFTQFQPHVDFELAETTFAPLEELPANPIAASIAGITARHGDFMQTYTGRQFFPMDPKPNEVCIRDIAHSLSLQCRYAGHCRRFYSVAEHSVHIARWLVGVAPEAALWGLLHDASEAYLIDVPRPVKPFLTGYKAAEAKVMAAVCARFGLPIEMPAAVHEADERIIADELVNLVPMSWHARHDDPLGVTLRYWSPAEAEEEFLETFKALSVEVW